jgi:integrase
MSSQNKRPRRGHGEGAIYWRESRKRWIAELKLENGKSKYFSGKTYAEAKQKLNQAQLEQRQGKLATGPKQTVKDFLHCWFEEVHAGALKLSARALYRRHLRNHIIPALGSIQLQKLRADQVQAFLNTMVRDGLKATTIQVIFAILNTALKDAVRWQLLTVNVCSAVTLPRVVPSEIRSLSKEEARRLLEVAKENYLHSLLTLALATGMRLGELLALRWEEVDLENSTLQVHHTVDYIQGYGKVESEPKTTSGRRRITLPQFAIEELERHRAYQAEMRKEAGHLWREQGLIITSMTGNHLGRSRVQKNFKQLLKKADLPDMHFHWLRHSAATILLSMGVSPKVVQELLGHSDIRTTLRIYGHVLPGMHKEAMDKMDDVFGSNEDEKM